MHNIHLLEYAQKYIKVPEWISIMIKMSRRRRYRRGQRGRFPKPVTIPNPSKVEKLVPEPRTNASSILIEPAEVEALRLVDLEGLSQEEAGKEMHISRGTIWRLLQSARRKVAQALTEGRPLTVTNVMKS
jgi:predicted DNA-binding protein (UPF0251 family)